MSDPRRCSYCAEPIRVEAIRCPHCRSRLTTFEAESWHRSHADARLAGVAAALGHAFSVPVGLVRLGFVLSSFVHLLGILVYVSLWAVMPPEPGRRSVLERGLVRAQRWARGLAGHADGDGGATDAGAQSPFGQVSPSGAGVINDRGDVE
jgi:phage shock protein PspC (stress-responsive transcriptional regulator)